MTASRATALIVAVLIVASTSALSVGAPVLVDRAPTWGDLRHRVLSTTTGNRLNTEAALRQKGQGPPHADADLRLFDAENENDVRVTFFCDSSRWCVYSQRVWIFLEEKRIPYKVKKLPLNAYGDKPSWFTRLVDGGKLPAIELDGTVHMESLEIMKLLDVTFPTHGPEMVPKDGTPDAKRADELMSLEKELERCWFSLVFYPVEGEALINARRNFLDVLGKVDDKLSETSGPWFLSGESPSYVDLQYISHMERIVASVLYWKGLRIRNTGDFHNVDLWLEAFEDRPSYMATKSDFYTLVMSIPSQNGPGYMIDEAREIADQIFGLDDAWKMSTTKDGGQAMARHEAAYKLIENHENDVAFAARGAGEPGRPSFHAELADPYAEPDYDYFSCVDVCLRHVTSALINGVETQSAELAKEDLAGRGGSGELREGWGEYKDDTGRIYWWNDLTGEAKYGSKPTRQLDSCLEYLRDRIGVPRDMGEQAAMQLRSHINWVFDLLQ